MWSGEMEANELFDPITTEDRNRECLGILQPIAADADYVLDSMNMHEFGEAEGVTGRVTRKRKST